MGIFGKKKDVPVAPPVEADVQYPVGDIMPAVAPVPTPTPVQTTPQPPAPAPEPAPAEKDEEELTEETVKQHLGYLHQQVAKIKEHLNLTSFE